MEYLFIGHGWNIENKVDTTDIQGEVNLIIYTTCNISITDFSYSDKRELTIKRESDVQDMVLTIVNIPSMLLRRSGAYYKKVKTKYNTFLLSELIKKILKDGNISITLFLCKEDLFKKQEGISSSGSSNVYIDDSTVYQQFLSKTVAERIANLMNKLKRRGEIVHPIKLQKGFGPKKVVLLDTTLKYEPFDNIVPFKFYVPETQVIAWEKITPLNSDTKLLSKEFLQNNYLKIWYDISKALVALKRIDIIHNDCVLDNIGIYKGNFVLFDFDGSGTPEQKGKDFDSDYETLEESFDFRGLTIPNMSKVRGINSLIEFVAKTQRRSEAEALEVLKKLKIK